MDKDKNLVFLRGVLKENEMTGSFFMKPVKGEPVTYLYTTIAPPRRLRKKSLRKRQEIAGLDILS